MLFAAIFCSAVIVYGASMLFYRFFIERKRVVSAPTPKCFEQHRRDVAAVHEAFSAFLQQRKAGELVSVQHSTASNRTLAPVYKQQCRAIDVSKLTRVVDIDTQRMLAHVEPGLAQDEMAKFCIAHGVIPQIVLEFPGITVGGALCGGGIESTSHQFGGFCDTVESVDLITGDGRFLQNVSRDNHSELFRGLCASYGTLGVLTRVAVRLHKAPKWVHIRYLHLDSPGAALDVMASLCNANAITTTKHSASTLAHTDDVSLPLPLYVDAVALSNSSVVVVAAVGVHENGMRDINAKLLPRLRLHNSRSDPWFFWHLTDIASRTPTLTRHAARNYTNAILSQVQTRTRTQTADASHEECTSLSEYLFRFDRGAFWMSKHSLAPHLGSLAYNSDVNARSGPAVGVRLLFAWLNTTRQMFRMLQKAGDQILARRFIVQDFIMPSQRAAADLINTTAETPFDIWPLWLCPIRSTDESKSALKFGVPQSAAGELCFNVGVYGPPRNSNISTITSKNGNQPFDPVVLNRALESKCSELGGRKMLYAQSFYSDFEFWTLYDKQQYEQLRTQYATHNGSAVFPSITSKVLLGEQRIDKLRGAIYVSPAAPLGANLLWLLTMLLELLLPRFMHERCGIHHTGMAEYRSAASR